MPRHNSPQKSAAELETPQFPHVSLRFYRLGSGVSRAFFIDLCRPETEKEKKRMTHGPGARWPSEAWKKRGKTLQKQRYVCGLLLQKGPNSISWWTIPHSPAVEAEGSRVLRPSAMDLCHRFLVAADLCGKSSPRPVAQGSCRNKGNT